MFGAERLSHSILKMGFGPKIEKDSYCFSDRGTLVNPKLRTPRDRVAFGSMG